MTPVDNGYLATPTTNIGNPVLVLHAWWGLNDTIKRFCDQLAEAGFVAYAPDLYRGQVTDQIDEAEKLAGSLDEHAERARADVDAGVSLLKERMGASYAGIAVIGFSLGAFYALDLSARDPENVHSVVIYYGAGLADFTQAKASYLGHFAEDDPYEPKENMDWLHDEITKAGRSVTFHTYPNTGHWFAEPNRTDAYSEEAASLAWERTLTFLKESFAH
jgi:carboxymethylenebutenolidase